MNITLDQARALEAFARGGTLQRAASILHKAHSAVLYGLNQLEQQTGLALFDRSGYRTRLTAAGHEVLMHCRQILAAESALARACVELRTGWEPVLRIVVDAIYPLARLFAPLAELRRQCASTQVHLQVDSLDGVARRFEAEHADLMIGVLPVAQEGLRVELLARLSAHLVVHRGHPLAARRRAALTAEDLGAYVLVTVRGGDPRLALPTAELERQSTVQLSDFHAKRAAILAGLGFGWLPDWLIRDDLRARTLVALRGPVARVHEFVPRLAHRGRLGPAAALVRGAILAG